MCFAYLRHISNKTYMVEKLNEIVFEQPQKYMYCYKGLFNEPDHDHRVMFIESHHAIDMSFFHSCKIKIGMPGILSIYSI